MGDMTDLMILKKRFKKRTSYPSWPAEARKYWICCWSFRKRKA